MTQVINQITLLTVILTGAALIREREQGTVEHLLVMPVVPAEIMLAKMLANGLVILVAAMLSLQFVVHWWIGAPIAGSLLLFLLGAALYALVVAALGILLGTLATTMGQFGLLAMPILIGHPIAFGQQHADGEHARLAAICDEDDQSDTAFRLLCAGRAVPRRRSHPRLAAASGHAHHRLGLFCYRHEPLPARHFRELIRHAENSKRRRQDERRPPSHDALLPSSAGPGPTHNSDSKVINPLLLAEETDRHRKQTDNMKASPKVQCYGHRHIQ